MTTENSNGEILRVAIYIRVSTEAQEEKYGLPMQINGVKGLIASKPETLVFAGDKYIYQDTITGSSPLDLRPEFTRLKEDLEYAAPGERPFDAIAVYRIDRFARSLKYLLEAVDLFEKHDVKFLSASESIDTSTPFGKAVLSFLGVIAELERHTINTRTRDGREQAFHKGVPVGSSARYGYFKNIDSRLEVLDEEAGVIRDIFRLFVTEKLSIHQISNHLRTSNILSPEASSIKHGKRRGEMRKKLGAYFWSPERVRYILSDEIYMGKMYGNKKKNGKPVPKNEWVLSRTSSPEIIDFVTFSNAQSLLKSDKHKRATTRDGHIYLLSGILRCDCCFDPAKDEFRSKWTGTRKYLSKQNRYLYSYICSRKNPSKTERVCKSLPLPAPAIEDYIVNFCKALLRDPVAVQNYQSKLKSQKIEYKTLQEREKHLLKVIGDVGMRIKNVRIQHEENIIDTPTMVKRIKDIHDEEAKLRMKLEEIAIQRVKNANDEEYTSAFSLIHEKYASDLEAFLADREALYTFLHQLIEEIVVFTRPLKDKDIVSGPKTEKQQLPYRLHIKFKLPDDLMRQFQVASSGYKSIAGAG